MKKILLAILPLFLIACSDDCQLSEGNTFISEELLEVGLGEEEEAMGHWAVVFSENTLNWIHSDISESGSFECNPTKVEAFSNANASNPANIELDRVEMRLEFENQFYRLSPSE